MIPDWLAVKAAGIIAVIAAVLALGAWGSTMLVQRNLARADAIDARAKLKTEQGKVRDWSTKFDDLKKFTGEQTAAIARLVDAQQEAEIKQATERAAAARQAQPHKDRARTIVEYQPPPGKDPAEETRLYIDQLLIEERAGAAP